MLNIKWLTNPMVYAILAWIFMGVDYSFTVYIFSVSPIPLVEANPLGIGIEAFLITSVFQSAWVWLGWVSNKLETADFNKRFILGLKCYVIFSCVFFILRSIVAVIGNYEVYKIVTSLLAPASGTPNLFL